MQKERDVVVVAVTLEESRPGWDPPRQDPRSHNSSTAPPATRRPIRVEAWG